MQYFRIYCNFEPNNIAMVECVIRINGSAKIYAIQSNHEYLYYDGKFMVELLDRRFRKIECMKGTTHYMFDCHIPGNSLFDELCEYLGDNKPP